MSRTIRSGLFFRADLSPAFHCPPSAPWIPRVWICPERLKQRAIVFDNEDVFLFWIFNFSHLELWCLGLKIHQSWIRLKTIAVQNFAFGELHNIFNVVIAFHHVSGHIRGHLSFVRQAVVRPLLSGWWHTRFFPLVLSKLFEHRHSIHHRHQKVQRIGPVGFLELSGGPLFHWSPWKRRTLRAWKRR